VLRIVIAPELAKEIAPPPRSLLLAVALLSLKMLSVTESVLLKLLKIAPPPLSAVLLLKATLSKVKCTLSVVLIAPPRSVVFPLIKARFFTVKSVGLVALALIVNAREVKLPLMVKPAAAAPSRVKLDPLGTTISPLVKVMVCPAKLGEKLIVSPKVAFATASRKEPAPLSLLLFTSIIAKSP